jgi:hypothetical protein
VPVKKWAAATMTLTTLTATHSPTTPTTRLIGDGGQNDASETRQIANAVNDAIF